MKNEEGRYLDMYSSEVRLGDSVIAPNENIIGEVWNFTEDEKIKVEAMFKVYPIGNGEVQLIRLKDNTFYILESQELITRNSRPFYSVYE